MATTRLSDVIVPEVFFPYMMTETMEKTAFFQSGIIKEDPALQAFIAGGGQTTNVPSFSDLSDASEAVIGTDDPSNTITPDKIGSFKQIGIRNIRAKAWSDMDLVREMIGEDPMQAIASRVAPWWGRSFQRYLISSMRGIIADNVANDSNDMVVDIGTDAVGTPAAAELISAEAIIDAQGTMGDASDSLSAIAMHSVVYNRLLKEDLIDFIPDSQGKVQFPTYLGYRVIKDDSMPAVAGTNRVKYHTYLFAEGAVAYAESPTAVPVETDRTPGAGNGTGQESLFTRRQFILHPQGFAFTSAGTIAGQFPTNAELEAAGSWDRVYPERKQVPIAVLITNG